MFDLLNSRKKKEALEELEKIQKDYKNILSSFNNDMDELYLVRKEAVKKVEEAEKILERIPGFGLENAKLIANAKASIKHFVELGKNKPATGTTSYTAITTAITASSLATFAGLAVATIIAGISEAIIASRLFDAFERKSASAKGITTTSTLGLISGAATGVMMITSTSRKNSKIAEEAEKRAKEFKRRIKQLEDVSSKIKELIKEIKNNCMELERSVSSTPNCTKSVVTIISLCSLINRRFSL